MRRARLLEFVARAAHVPVARDQAHRFIIVLRQPAQRFFGIGPGVDGFAAEVDATVDQLRLPGTRRARSALVTDGIGAGDQQPLRLALPKHVDGMLDAAVAAGQHDGRVGRGSFAGAGLPSVKAKRMKPSA